MTYKPSTRGCLDGCDRQILTTNNKTIRECITKGKLALEIAKFVWNDFESIKVNVTFICLIVSFLTSTWAGRIGFRRHNLREHGVSETGTCLKSVLATGALV